MSILFLLSTLGATSAIRALVSSAWTTPFAGTVLRGAFVRMDLVQGWLYFGVGLYAFTLLFGRKDLLVLT